MATPRRLEQRLFVWSVILGTLITLATLIIDQVGLLTPLEQWIYDQRAHRFQYFSKPPSDQIVHLDIDDKALEAIGQWPWPRSRLARLLDELRIAEPKVVGVDVLFSEPQEPRWIPQKDEKFILRDDDQHLAESFQRMDNALLGVSLFLTPPRSISSFDSAVEAELRADLELSPGQMLDRLEHRGYSRQDAAARLTDAVFLPARRQAAFERIRIEMDSNPLPPEDLFAKLLPNTDLSLSTPLKRILEEQFSRYQMVQSLRRFALPLPPSIEAPLPTQTNALPLARFGNTIHGCGFVDVETGQSVLRYMPLLVEHDHRLLPQFGFAFACFLAGSDPTKLKIGSDLLTLPTPNGEISVPVRSQPSALYQRDIPLIVDVPWFGGRRWESMYDWPNHVESRQHLSMSTVWQLCETHERIIRNNAQVDDAVMSLLAEEGMQLDPALARKYQEQIPAPHDVAGRREIIAQSLKILQDAPTYQLLAPAKMEDLSAEEQEYKRIFDAAKSALEAAGTQNPALLEQLQKLRADLRAAVQGKGVLIGWTATGRADFVTTPLHARCPGVVVHGVIANAVLTGEWWRTAPLWLGPLLTLLLGLGTALTVARFSPHIGLAVAMLSAISYLLMNGLLLFDWGNYILPAAGPLVVIAAVWALVTLTRAILEGLERIRVARDLAVMNHEMQLARVVQMALIPKENAMPKIEGIDSWGWNLPADLTGGDCFDLWKLPDGRLGILLADASGHGLAPSMIVSQTRTLVRTLSDLENHPDPLLKRVNERLSEDLEAARFVTCFLGFLNSEGELQWCSAGHGPILWRPKADESWQELEAGALPLGVMSDWLPDAPSPALQLDTGGMLLVMSDGIFEAPRPDREQFGVERVLEILKRMPDATSMEIIAAIREAVTKWQVVETPVDDQTMIVIRKVAAGVSVMAVGQNASGDQNIATVDA